MISIFISGSISETKLPDEVVKVIDNSCEKGYSILIGDANGIDKVTQNFLSKKDYKNVTVYHIGDRPRNFLDCEWTARRVYVDDGDETILNEKGKYTRKAQMKKDELMSKEADIALVVWNDAVKNRFGKLSVSKGSLNNIVNMLMKNKYVGLFYIPTPQAGVMKFKKISDFEDKIIDKLVKKETRDYYYNMKKWESKRKANSILSEKNEQLTIF